MFASAGNIARFRAVLFRMVPKQEDSLDYKPTRFKAVLFRMVPKPESNVTAKKYGFRAVLFRMVPKLVLTRPI